MDSEKISSYAFDDIEEMKRRPDIEAKGTKVGFPGGNGDRWMRIAAASSNNPYWRAQQDRIAAKIKAYEIAKAPDPEVRAYLAGKYATLLVRDWGGWTNGGVPIPFSAEACTALLVQADDAYKIVHGMVYNDAHFRSEEVKAVLEEGKGS